MRAVYIVLPLTLACHISNTSQYQCDTMMTRGIACGYLGVAGTGEFRFEKFILIMLDDINLAAATYSSRQVEVHQFRSLVR